MARAQQDQVIDDDENDTCPLCIEEFDLSDRNFRPCPCGYQICQFCYNNIKTTMNGLCPACRRVYDDKNIQWKSISPEELASHRESAHQAAKKKQAAKQKEAAKREADGVSRKHLAGIRVRQKNLVYITGMRPNQGAENLSETLRRDEYFGQYGKIIKVVVSKAKDPSMPNAPVGVYVTFANKDDAARCIQAVDGSQNYDSRLRAQYGTTKYCSSYLRGETCGKPGCMFLHEPGDENESFSRQDLSSMNVISTQSPSQNDITTAGQLPPEPYSLLQQSLQPIPIPSNAHDQRESKDEPGNTADGLDTSALPQTASWATRPTPSRSTSQAQNIASSSPKRAGASQPPRSIDNAETQRDLESSLRTTNNRNVKVETQPRDMALLLDMLGVRRAHSDSQCGFVFDERLLSHQDRELLAVYPPLFDPYGAARRSLSTRSETERTIRETDTQVASQALSAMDLEETAEGGSLQLGGEPEERQDTSVDGRQRHNVVQPAPELVSSPIFGGLESTLSPASLSASGTAGRSLAPQQQQLLLQHLKSSSPNTLGAASAQPPIGPGHTRQGSRYSFANDSSASASVKTVANPKLMNQQNSMMPPTHSGQFNSLSQPQQTANQYFSSGVQGPPPGLKATGTPPVSGGGMFGQGHGFATAGLGYGVNATNRNANDEMMRELLRNRGGSAGSGPTSEAGRREYMFPSVLQHSSQSSSPAPHPGLSSFPHGPQPGVFQDHGSQKQKKKGKKHRHANTSSSGGGVVDLADPSIMQAQSRTHQPGGLYGAQGQGQGTDSVIPGPSSTFSGNDSLGAKAKIHDAFARPEELARRTNMTSAFEPMQRMTDLRSFSLEDSQSLNPTQVSMPELGRIPQPLNAAQSPQGETKVNAPEVSQHSATDDRRSRSPVSVNRGGLKTSLETNNEALFPALPKLPKVIPKDMSPKKPNAGKRAATVPRQEDHDSRPSGMTEKRLKNSLSRDELSIAGVKKDDQKLKNLDAAGALGQANATMQEERSQEVTNKPEIPSKESSKLSPSTGSRSVSPIQAADIATKAVAQPRTIRVLPSSKPDSSSQRSASSGASTPGNVSKFDHNQQRSRQPSIASASVVETPASDKIPDSASVATEPPSRASSPPSSAMENELQSRKMTKSQKRKEIERQKRVKISAEGEKSAEVETASATEAIVREPIVGRKKKSRKPTQSSAALPPSATGIENQPTAIAEDLEEAHQDDMTDASIPAQVVLPSGKDNKSESERRGDEKDESTQKSTPFAARILQDLQASNNLPSTSLNFFKQPQQILPRGQVNMSDTFTPPSYNPLSEDEVHTLESGIPVRRIGSKEACNAEPWLEASSNVRVASRLLITPYSRMCFRGLPPDLETRLLELEERVYKSRPPFRYSHRYSDNFPQNERLNIHHQLMEIASAMAARASNQVTQSNQQTPSGTSIPSAAPKLPAYADDALAYLDKHILPAPPTRNESRPAPTNLVENMRGGRPVSLPATVSADLPEGSSIGTAIPRTYTTGEPTFSVSGVDVSSHSAHVATVGATTAARSGTSQIPFNPALVSHHPVPYRAPSEPNLDFLADHEAVTEALAASFRIATQNLPVTRHASTDGLTSGSVNNAGAHGDPSIPSPGPAPAHSGQDPLKSETSYAAVPTRHGLGTDGDSIAADIVRTAEHFDSTSLAFSAKSPMSTSNSPHPERGAYDAAVNKPISLQSRSSQGGALAYVEQQLQLARKKTEKLDKELKEQVRKNRRIAGLVN